MYPLAPSRALFIHSLIHFTIVYKLGQFSNSITHTHRYIYLHIFWWLSFYSAIIIICWNGVHKNHRIINIRVTGMVYFPLAWTVTQLGQGLRNTGPERTSTVPRCILLKNIISSLHTSGAMFPGILTLFSIKDIWHRWHPMWIANLFCHVGSYIILNSMRKLNLDENNLC